VLDVGGDICRFPVAELLPFILDSFLPTGAFGLESLFQYPGLSRFCGVEILFGSLFYVWNEGPNSTFPLPGLLTQYFGSYGVVCFDLKEKLRPVPGFSDH